MKLKKILALVLVVMMMATMLIACGDKESDTTKDTTKDTTTTDTTKDTTTTDTTKDTTTQDTTPADTTKPGNVTDLEVKEWNRVLNVIVNNWYGNGEPWSPVEPLTTEYGKDDLHDAVLDRAAYIEDTYKITINWTTVGATDTASVANALAAGTNDYDIWMNKLLKIQAIVAAGLVYDLGDSEYINFDKTYYSDLAYDSFTVAGHTFFAAGDFNYIDKMASYCIFVNKDMAETVADFPDLYELVRDGEWTIDTMFSLAQNISEDVDKNQIMDENDTYGYVTNTLTNWYVYAGIPSVKVENDKYVVNLESSACQKVISYVLQATNSDWFASSGSFTSTDAMFNENRCLFYQEVVQKLSWVSDDSALQDCYVVPNPKLDPNEDVYYSATVYHAQAMCIPKTAPDRDFSEYCFELLFATASEYIMPEFLMNITAGHDIDEDMYEMITDYIWPGVLYDVGNITYDWSSLCSSITNPSINNRVNSFTSDYDANIDTVQGTLDTWNTNWANYVED